MGTPAVVVDDSVAVVAVVEGAAVVVAVAEVSVVLTDDGDDVESVVD